MPPPFADRAQIARALEIEAMPALERLAQNPSLRDGAVSRFDRDEPPPYVSSTEDDDEDMPHPAPDLVDHSAADVLERLLDEPLDSDHLDSVAWDLANQARVYCPGTRFDLELKREIGRIERWLVSKASANTKHYFIQYGPARKGRAGRERLHIIARRNIRRRWQKLGVWNPDWGFPGRENKQPNDDTYEWKWPWQHGDASAEWRRGAGKMSLNPRHPVTRALQLRQGLRRSEHTPVVPRSHGPHASASQAESFITSRPWFMYSLELSEEFRRVSRLPDTKTRRLYKGSMVGNIRELWKERGEWKDDWVDKGLGTVLVGWKWRHESPSPEPEDLSGLEDLATFELTPSEVDALEAVRPPSPPTPPRYVPPDPTQPPSKLFRSILDATPPAAPEKTTGQSPDASDEPLEQPVPRRRRQRRPQQPPAQPLRRSARIAAMAAKRPPPAPVSNPSSRRRGPPKKKNKVR